MEETESAEAVAQSFQAFELANSAQRQRDIDSFATSLHTRLALLHSLVLAQPPPPHSSVREAFRNY